MKEDTNIPENKLAKWLIGKLTTTELDAFKKTKDYALYKKIAEESDKLKLPKPNLKEKFEQQLAYNKSLNKDLKQNKTRLLRPWIYSTAAAIALLLGLQLFLNQDKAITTDLATKQTITLPDGSIAVLNAASKLSYDENNFLKKRVLKLEGEAFFKVKKGSSFIVNTPNGTIKVLGTKFNVFTRKTTLRVFCDEGKVAVNSKGDNLVLTKGMGAFSKAGYSLQYTPSEIKSPQWRIGRSTFLERPLGEVVAELERQFNVKINVSDINTERLYTGTFTHQNLRIAMKAVCMPMNITYSINENNVQLHNK